MLRFQVNPIFSKPIHTSIPFSPNMRNIIIDVLQKIMCTMKPVVNPPFEVICRIKRLFNKSVGLRMLLLKALTDLNGTTIVIPVRKVARVAKILIARVLPAHLNSGGQ